MTDFSQSFDKVLDAESASDLLASLSAEQRVEWVRRFLPAPLVLSSSFGAQAAVMLHLITRQLPNIPVVVVDTGYLFNETYDFIDELTKRLSLNLHIARPTLSPAWLERRHGKLWEQGVEGLNQYNHFAKVQPMQNALKQLNAQVWFSGVRRSQSQSRANTKFAEFKNGRWKIHPIADWTDRDVGVYLKENQLPYHPLWDQGYVSIGDTHTTRKLEAGMSEEDTRFFGLKRECGLHTDV